MGTTIGIKTWLASVFPKMIPSVKEKTLADQILEADSKIEANRVRLRNAVLRYTSMSRVAEIYLNANIPRSNEIAYEFLVGYRTMLMESYKIAEDDLLSVEETKKLLMEGEMF